MDILRECRKWLAWVEVVRKKKAAETKPEAMTKNIYFRSLHPQIQIFGSAGTRFRRNSAYDTQERLVFVLSRIT